MHLQYSNLQTLRHGYFGLTAVVGSFGQIVIFAKSRVQPKVEVNRCCMLQSGVSLGGPDALEA